MLKRLFHYFEWLFDRPAIEEIAAYQHKLPRSIRVEASYDEQTKFYTATITKVDKDSVKGLLITESRSIGELIERINDLLLTHLDIPERIKPSMPKLLPEDVDYADQLVNTKHSKLVLAK